VLGLLFTFVYGMTQPSFTKSSKLIGDKSLSNITLLTADINKDLKDDIIYLEGGIHMNILLQSGQNKPFTTFASKKVDDTPQWSMLTADIDKDGRNEFFPAGVYDNIKYLTINSSGNLIEKLSFGSGFYAQGSNLVDFNNDGYLDLYFCNDDNANRLYIYDPLTKLFKEDKSINYATIPASDMSGNYNSEWIDIDDDGVLELFIAKCRAGVDSELSPLRINQLYVKSNGVYINEAAERGMADGSQSWVGAWGDADNDGDLDCFVANHYGPNMLMINDGNGYFSSIEINTDNFTFQAIWRDIDNDGFQDILIAGADKDLFLMNNGDLSFEVLDNYLGVARANSLMTGDYNDDGFIDLFYSYGKDIVQPGSKYDELWLNDRNENNWLKVNLLGTTSNAEGIGAKLYLYADGQLYFRHVKGGESYSITNSYQQHFGLGTHANIDSLIIKWPSGIIDKHYNLSVNTKYFAQENECMTSRILEATPNHLLCEGDSILLNANEGFSQYLWSNGDTNENITVKSPGLYTYRAYDENGCIYQSDGFYITEEPAYKKLPIINSNFICEDGFLEIKTSLGQEFLWNDGSNSPNLEVSEAGIFDVNILTACGDVIADTILLVETPNDFLLVENDSIIKSENGVLSSSNDVIYWYQNDDDLLPFDNSDSILFENVQADLDVYYEILNYDGIAIENFANVPFDLSNLYGGSTFNAGLYFDAHEDIILKDVKVYSKIAGKRKIQILNNANEVVFSKIIFVDEGQQLLNLNAFIPAANDYIIIANEDYNLEQLGTIGSQFGRLNNGVTYDISQDGTPIQITTSTRGNATFYHFYAWTIIKNPSVCFTDRQKASVIVDISSASDDILDETKIYPNPTESLLYIMSDKEIELFQIKNNVGKVLLEGEPSNKTIDLSSLFPGIYVICLFNEDSKFVSKKFIKH
jgi:hypothetical protein